MTPEYKVLKIREMLRPGEGEGVEKFYRHTIKTRGGTVLNVEVAESDFTEGQVATILKGKVLEADKILKLQG